LVLSHVVFSSFSASKYWEGYWKAQTEKKEQELRKVCLFCLSDAVPFLPFSFPLCFVQAKDETESAQDELAAQQLKFKELEATYQALIDKQKKAIEGYLQQANSNQEVLLSVHSSFPLS
jgi:hypothetical protein